MPLQLRPNAADDVNAFRRLRGEGDGDLEPYTEFPQK
jgi:hypothetical protein